MMYGKDSIQGYAGAGVTGTLGGPGLGQAQTVPVRSPSMEQRLDYLQRGLERLNAIRVRLVGIADRTEIQYANKAETENASKPSASDLSGRFADAINYLHTNLDDLERLIQRLDHALFDSAAVATQANYAGSQERQRG